MWGSWLVVSRKKGVVGCCILLLLYLVIKNLSPLYSQSLVVLLIGGGSEVSRFLCTLLDEERKGDLVRDDFSKLRGQKSCAGELRVRFEHAEAISFHINSTCLFLCSHSDRPHARFSFGLRKSHI